MRWLRIIVSRRNYIITTTVHLALCIPEAVLTPFEYAGVAAKWEHRLLIIHINILYLRR